MSKKKKKEPVAPSTPEPFLIRFYNHLRPAKKAKGYTAKENFHHLIFMWVIIAVLILLLAFAWWLWQRHENYLVSSELYLPPTNYTEAQMSNVIETLQEQGFPKVIYDEERKAICAYGTPEQVEAYKASFQEKFLQDAETILAQDWTELGLISIDFTDNQELELYTLSPDITATDLKFMLSDSRLQQALNTVATWYGMNHPGEKLTIKFINNTNQANYYTTQAQTVSELISQVERRDLDAFQETLNAETANTGLDESLKANTNQETTVSSQNIATTNETAENAETSSIEETEELNKNEEN